ncbi:MAG: sigma-70 family RNA polymerase sigma factor [Lentisphaeraceae bacterium]|nr:sigma-70 family RNA polymerase sigma factor [Lentisphaeraceae bacterium]
MMDDLDQLILQVKAGKREAFSQIVRLTQNRLRGFIMWYVPVASEVDDIAQDVYLYVFDNLSQYEPGSDFQAWLREIARYRSLNRARKVSRQMQRENRYAEHLILENEPENDQIQNAQEDRIDLMKKCLNKLPEKSQQLIKQRYFQNLNSEDLSEKLSMSAAGIRMTLMRVRNLLRECISSETANG